jgi:hypothetical protein
VNSSRPFVLAAGCTLLVTRLAAAQTSEPTVAGGTTRGLLAAAHSLSLASAEEAQRSSGGRSTRNYTPRAFIGLTSGEGDTGLILGGGISTRPFRKKKHELQFNADYQRVFDENGFGLDIDYYYNFTGRLGQFTPYAGAGLVVTDIASETETDLQIGGGIRRPLRSVKEFFVEILILLGDYNPLLIRTGFGW